MKKHQDGRIRNLKNSSINLKNRDELMEENKNDGAK